MEKRTANQLYMARDRLNRLSGGDYEWVHSSAGSQSGSGWRLVNERLTHYVTENLSSKREALAVIKAYIDGYTVGKESVYRRVILFEGIDGEGVRTI